MAKFKNKINKNKMRKKNVQSEKEFTGLKHDMHQFMQAEDYVEAIDVMAEMAVNKKMDGEVMYWGAQCYFLTGDFERAERWAGNALNNGYNSAGIKVLLANLCVAEERYEDACKLCEVALSEGAEAMTGLDKEIFDDFMDNIRYGNDELVAKYPLISKYLAKDDSASQSAPSQFVDESPEPEIQKTAPSEDNVKTEAEENADKAQAALAKLRQLLSKNKASEEDKEAEDKAEAQEVVVTREVIAAKPAQAEEQEASQPAASEAHVDMPQAEDACAERNGEEFDVAGTLEKIAAKEASLAEKVRLINVFAGACYQGGDYQAAFDLLSAALEIDGQDAATLKNIAYTCLSAGEKEQALSFAAELPVADFGLLYALKQN